MSKRRQNEDCTEQIGTVVGTQKNKVSVHIEQKSACANCHSRGACTSMDKQDKVIDVATADFESYNIGDRVKVSITQRLGLKAVVIAFLVPFLWLMLVLVVSLKCFGMSEALASLMCLLAIVIYYVALFFLRDKIGKQFVFKLSRL